MIKVLQAYRKQTKQIQPIQGIKNFLYQSKVPQEQMSLLASRRGATHGNGRPKKTPSCGGKSAPQPHTIVCIQRSEDGPGDASDVRCPLARYSLQAQSRICAT